ncbi:TetR/AcrR family transcriptional regulator [Acidipropionibacterium acidipropionici]|jgi:AcrR family transcriptional regulator|uniref:TetR family transcriptional regulator n=2 Tax=Acidipropionibacterium acidipropionici TaxID=1748 RepID=A0AAC8YHL2_9ACTN|nr:TetR/AcrR family transcriptional regulator [Acidipropionibacterium acidipropionici]AFV88798.1 Transcriptional regulator, TetR family [Acidipropionibacterium acidipropionici ATCC 4875]AMS06540.1 TetR family transcriptional regulator [Acidipropionibacterium acidipropionici]AOZ47984.1 TetR family transcriptional regulator [Acidipropionibacterium acidipropionici]
MKSNRGPAAADSNRRALLASARRLFAERGIGVPLSAIAKDAGVGQGVLYRHFPNRSTLAMAVFEENLDHLDQVAAEAPEGRGFTAVWGEILEMVLTDIAFIEMAVASRRDTRARGADTRLGRLLEPLLTGAREAGAVAPSVKTMDLLRTLRACYGVVVTAMDPPTARADVAALMKGLGLPGPDRS